MEKRQHESRILSQHLDILFSRVQPEYLMLCVQNKNRNGAAPYLDPAKTSCLEGAETYQHYAQDVLCHLNPDEIENMFLDMQEHIQKREDDCGGRHIFSLLPEYTKEILVERNGVPLCRRDQVINWRECSLLLGQDMLVTAHLAYEQVKRGVSVRSFCWPAQIHTDDARLNHLLERGLAENHFHLKGSARIWDISWLCMMNHPDRIHRFFSDEEKPSGPERKDLFRQNLHAGTMRGPKDNQWPWDYRLDYAAWLRSQLFQWLRNGPEREDKQRERTSFFLQCLEREVRKIPYMVFPDPFFLQRLEREVQIIRYMVFPESSVLQKKAGRPVCLDYAAALDRWERDRNNPYRILCGERAFLYYAFVWIFSGRIQDRKASLTFQIFFYLYLLLKTQFRKEIILVNGQMGFRNFARYENRKELLFEDFPEYRVEAYNTSVGTAIQQEHIVSQEMRITPKDSPTQNLKAIWGLDRKIACLMGEEESNWSFSPEYLKRKRAEDPYFYVVHFVKEVDRPDRKKTAPDWCQARNRKVRRRVRRQALALARAMEQYNYLCGRIRGIDACNFEIGCRPEVFATEFRFLRDFVPSYTGKDILQKGVLVPHLSVTYHAGEDFLDLADGMRAIEEAILFLDMRRGERLGHAVALGIDPQAYYRKKAWHLVMPKQGRLDDLVWLLSKSQRLGVSVDPVLLQKLGEEAFQLLGEIYGADDLRGYYGSWLLRGDDPELYRFGRFDRGNCKELNSCFWPGLQPQVRYHCILRNSRIADLDLYRNHACVQALYSAYHYDRKARIEGEKMTTLSITPSYAKLMEQIQERMQREMADLGIAIECCPSSNVLIAPIDGYREHPIFRFAPVREDGHSGAGLYVSVNTDDQGVFDTSLANEYALLMNALIAQCQEDGSRRYADDAVYEYLERLRINGITQTFPGAEQSAQTKKK